MEEVIFDCDRCGTTVTGHRDEYFTAGFYEVGEGSPWRKYAQDGEERICDPCMWSNADYIMDYAHDGEARQWREEQDG